MTTAIISLVARGRCDSVSINVWNSRQVAVRISGDWLMTRKTAGTLGVPMSALISAYSALRLPCASRSATIAMRANRLLPVPAPLALRRLPQHTGAERPQHIVRADVAADEHKARRLIGCPGFKRIPPDGVVEESAALRQSHVAFRAPQSVWQVAKKCPEARFIQRRLALEREIHEGRLGREMPAGVAMMIVHFGLEGAGERTRIEILGVNRAVGGRED